ncbi:MAG: hypothetical protein HQL43_15575 [Alphaproteobacteria bacterium]|nr:hypothetical protein [Alphaproteobacteria bacterium]
MFSRHRTSICSCVCLSLFVQLVVPQTAVAQNAAPQTGATAPAEEAAERGLFLAALAPVLGFAAEKLVNYLFSPSPTRANMGEARPTVDVTDLAVNGAYYAGLAYEVYLVQPSGQIQRINPQAHIFSTGDQFFVKYIPNMPGMIDVSNVNPEGRESRLGRWSVAAGQQVTLPAQGTFQFSGVSGDEILKIAHTPCTSGAPTKDIVINAAATVNYGTLLPYCSATPNYPTRTKDITINIQGGTAYAVSQLSPEELQTQSIVTRVATARFQHSVGYDYRVISYGRPLWRGGWLVTPDEAAQPASRVLVPAKSDPGGPKVLIKTPSAVSEVKPPVNIEVTFEPLNGEQIDLKSLKVTYLALINVDITDRLAPYLTPSGIHAEGADLPVGDHTIELAIKDGAGRRSVERLSFKVLEQ